MPPHHTRPHFRTTASTETRKSPIHGFRLREATPTKTGHGSALGQFGTWLRHTGGVIWGEFLPLPCCRSSPSPGHFSGAFLTGRPGQDGTRLTTHVIRCFRWTFALAGRRGLRSNGSEFTIGSIALYHLHDAVHHAYDVDVRQP